MQIGVLSGIEEQATRFPSGEIAGASPFPSSFGAPPSLAADQTCICGCTVLDAALGCSGSGQLAS
ncbi:MAG: hypothetical protein WA814_13165 [Candidatus Baltobacteraceae bacterium]